jgi:type IV pilus assembly protein PilF
MRTVPTLPLAFAALLLAGCVTESSPNISHTPASLTQAAAINTQLGYEHLQNGRRAEAVLKFEKAIDQDPKNASAYLGLAMINDQVGDQKEARKHYEEAIDAAPDDPVVQNAYAAWLCKMGDAKRAEAQFTSAAKNLRYQTPEVALTNAGICMRRNKLDDKAEAHFRAALKENPNYGGALAEMADLSLARNDALRSRAFVQRLLEQGRPDARTLHLAYRTELALNDPRAAQRYADQLKRDYPGSAQAKELGAR